MRAPLSIIIPTWNAAAELPATLAHLVEGLDQGLIREVVVSDGGSQDHTVAIAETWGANVVTGAQGRGAQLRAGGNAAQGDWLLFLHADTWLAAGWADAVMQQFTHGSPACFTLQFRAKGFGANWTAGWANWRTDLFGLPYGDQGLLIRAADYHAIGGYPDQPLMEDVEIAKRLSKIKRLKTKAFTGADKYQTQGWFKRGWKNLGLLVRYKLGASPDDLARAYASRSSEN